MFRLHSVGRFSQVPFLQRGLFARFFSDDEYIEGITNASALALLKPGKKNPPQRVPEKKLFASSPEEILKLLRPFHEPLPRNDYYFRPLGLRVSPPTRSLYEVYEKFLSKNHSCVLKGDGDLLFCTCLPMCLGAKSD